MHGYLILGLKPNKKAGQLFLDEKENINSYVITTIALWYQKGQSIKETVH